MARKYPRLMTTNTNTTVMATTGAYLEFNMS